MTKLIESRTVQILPGGVTMTTLHLSPEGRRGLSTGGAQIPAPHVADPPDARALLVLRIADLPVARVQQPPGEIRHALRSPALGCVISAIVLQLLGAPAFVILVCQALVVIAIWNGRLQKKQLLGAKALRSALHVPGQAMPREHKLYRIEDAP